MKTNPILVASIRFAASICLLASAGTATASLIGFYDFEGTTNDTSGNNNNPVAGSVTGYTAGMEGQAAIFNGFSDSLHLPINISPGVMPAVTMGAWVYANSITGGRAILSADDNSPADYDRQIGIDNRGNGPGTFAYSAFAGSNTGVLSSGQAVTSQFTFVAARYEGTNVTLFVDGQIFSGFDTNADQTQNPQLWIGKNPFFNSHFDGLIDNVFVFDEALSDTQVQNIRTSGSGAAFAAVPEPGSATLLGFGAFSLLARRRRAQA